MNIIEGIFQGNKNTKNNQPQNSNNTKNHYFIGSVLNNDLLNEKLKSVRKKIISKYKLKELHYPNLFMNKMIYLGYLTKDIAELYMNKIINFLCKSIAKNFSKLKCNFSIFNLVYDNKFYKISLETNDENNVLKNN